MPKQFQDFLKSIGLSIENILEQSGILNILPKEKIQLSTEEYYLFLKKIDEVITDEKNSAISNIDNLNVFIPSFFAALSSKNGQGKQYRSIKKKKNKYKIRHKFGVFFCKIINCIDFFSKRLCSNFYQSILVQIHNRIVPFVNLLLDHINL